MLTANAIMWVVCATLGIMVSAIDIREQKVGAGTQLGIALVLLAWGIVCLCVA